VTLLGQVRGSEAEVLEKTRSLAQGMTPFGMHFLGFGTTDERFKQLFIQIERDRNMTTAKALAEKTFGKTEPGEYMPHLSLAYGNLDPDAKSRIISAEKGLLDCWYDAAALAVARTPDDLKDWKLVGVFPLAKSRETAPAP
jgi:2'-5' RNA ligase